MSTVRYFRHDDVGAPTLTGEVGSLTNLLRKCLVGTAGVAYGSKASAGWTEEFVGAASNIAVFRNNEGEGGSGCYVLVNDNASTGGGAQEASLICYSAMTEVNSGVFGTALVYFRKSGASSSAARPWIVVADGLTAWVYVFNNGRGPDSGSSSVAVAGFGDYVSQYDGFYRNYFTMGSNTSNSSNGSAVPTLVIGSASAALSIGSIDGVSAYLMPSLSHVISLSGTVGGSSYPTGGDPISGVMHWIKNPYLVYGGRLIGRIRGMLLPCSNIQSFTRGAAAPDISDSVFMYMKGILSNQAGDAGGFLVDTAGPWL